MQQSKIILTVDWKSKWIKIEKGRWKDRLTSDKGKRSKMPKWRAKVIEKGENLLKILTTK